MFIIKTQAYIFLSINMSTFFGMFCPVLLAWFAPEWVAYFAPEWVTYFTPERWHTIVRIIHKMDFNGFQAAGKYVFAGHDQILIKMFDCKVNK